MLTTSSDGMSRAVVCCVEEDERVASLGSPAVAPFDRPPPPPPPPPSPPQSRPALAAGPPADRCSLFPRCPLSTCQGATTGRAGGRPSGEAIEQQSRGKNRIKNREKVGDLFSVLLLAARCWLLAAGCSSLHHKHSPCLSPRSHTHTKQASPHYHSHHHSWSSDDGRPRPRPRPHPHPYPHRPPRSAAAGPTGKMNVRDCSPSWTPSVVRRRGSSAASQRVGRTTRRTRDTTTTRRMTRRRSATTEWTLMGNGTASQLRPLTRTRTRMMEWPWPWPLEACRNEVIEGEDETYRRRLRPRRHIYHQPRAPRRLS